MGFQCLHEVTQNTHLISPYICDWPNADTSVIGAFSILSGLTQQETARGEEQVHWYIDTAVILQISKCWPLFGPLGSPSFGKSFHCTLPQETRGRRDSRGSSRIGVVSWPAEMNCENLSPLKYNILQKKSWIAVNASKYIIYETIKVQENLLCT